MQCFSTSGQKLKGSCQETTNQTKHAAAQSCPLHFHCCRRPQPQAAALLPNLPVLPPLPAPAPHAAVRAVSAAPHQQMMHLPPSSGAAAAASPRWAMRSRRGVLWPLPSFCCARLGPALCCSFSADPEYEDVVNESSIGWENRVDCVSKGR